MEERQRARAIHRSTMNAEEEEEENKNAAVPPPQRRTPAADADDTGGGTGDGDGPSPFKKRRIEEVRKRGFCFAFFLSKMRRSSSTRLFFDLVFSLFLRGPRFAASSRACLLRSERKEYRL